MVIDQKKYWDVLFFAAYNRRCKMGEEEEEQISADPTSDDAPDKKSKKKKKEGGEKSKKKAAKQKELLATEDTSVLPEDAPAADEPAKSNAEKLPMPSAASLKPSRNGESEQNGTHTVGHTAEPQVATPVSEREPTGPKVSMSESMTYNTEEQKKTSHVAMLVNPIKEIVEDAALKPLLSAASKVKEDVGLLVRDPKEFAKQKKCEVCHRSHLRVGRGPNEARAATRRCGAAIPRCDSTLRRDPAPHCDAAQRCHAATLSWRAALPF